MEKLGPNIYLFLPMIAAVCYGLGYNFIAHILKSNISLPTYQVVYALVMLFCALFIATPLTGEKLNLMPLADPKVLLQLVGLCLLFWCAVVVTFLAIKHVSPTYAALAEISYPLFTILFAWLIYRDTFLTWQTGIGGALILVGSIVIVAGQAKQMSTS
jgi:drug/metabolite transporter (DMT)-like permease